MSLTVTAAPPALPVPLRPPVGVAAVLAALVLAALSAVYAAGAKLGGFDGRAQPLEGLRPRLRDLAVLIDFGGEPVGAAVLVAILVTACLVLRRPRIAVLAVAGPGLAVVVTSGLKRVVGRTIHGDFLSFPSGHTAIVTAMAIVFALLVVNLRWPGTRSGMLLILTAAVIAGAAMAWSQVILSAHYPTDTLGGFCAALAAVPATAWLVDLTVRRRRRPVRRLSNTNG